MRHGANRAQQLVGATRRGVAFAAMYGICLARGVVEPLCWFRCGGVIGGAGEAVGDKAACFDPGHTQLRRPYELCDAIVKLTDVFGIGMIAA